MNIRLTKNSLQTIGGILVLIVLMCAGMFLYARWDLKRFKQSLEEPPKVSPVTVAEREEMINTPAEEPPPAEATAPKSLTQHNIELESTKLEIETPSLETLDSLIDEIALLEGKPPKTDTADIQHESLEKEEVPWTDEFQEEIDSGSGFARLISVLESGNIDIGTGDPEDVATIVKILKRAAKGPVAVDDLVTMMEAWLRIQPDTPHGQLMVNESHDSVMKALSRLRAIKEESLQSGKETKRIFRIY